MADPELEAIRQRRMQELMARHGVGNQQNPEQQKAQDDAKTEAEERRQMMLSQMLSAEARERIARIALVKPEKARGVEDVILRAAQMGQITEKVSEERLISLLEQINNQTTRQTKVTVSYRIFVTLFYSHFPKYLLCHFLPFQIQRRRSVLEDDD
ncbi:Programmed cell death protein 5 [Spatholobus suberectus]|nr:Programmed cell death protein 5 [Spatholobus suberectus]